MPNKLLHGHFQFQRSHFERRESIARLAVEGQKPLALYVGCSDSRVVPELFTSASPGELFVIRNVGAFVPARQDADASVGAAIEYAINALGVQHVVVCGHSGCGAVKAALEGRDKLGDAMPELRTWLAGIEAGVAPVRGTGLSGDDLVRTAVEENVLVSLHHLMSYEAVARALGAGRLQLHAWYYDMGSLSLAVYDPDADAFVAPAPAD
jgi:carbonic anhydrase